MRTVTECCKENGIELRGDDGQPYHCGERMSVRSGIIGPDYATCKCGLAIGNLASPHVSGAIMSKAWFEEHRDRTWVKVSE